MMSISVLIPAYNEEESVGKVINEIKHIKKIGEIIVINDGSTDKTEEIARKCGVKVITNQTNTGYGASLKKGIRAASGDIIVIIDADGTYSGRDIVKLIKHADKYDMVVGARSGMNIPFLRKPAKFILSSLANYLVSFKIPDLNSGLRVFKKKDILQFFNILPIGFSFTSTITLSYLSSGYSVEFVPISYNKRSGKSKINPIIDSIYMFLLIIRTMIYFKPFKVFLPACAFFMFVGIIVAIYSFLNFKSISTTALFSFFIAIQIGFFSLFADLLSKK